PSADAAALAAFIEESIEPGSVVLTDGWCAYPPAFAALDARGLSYTHKVEVLSAHPDHAHVVFPPCPSGRRTVQALAARHPPGFGRSPPSRLVPRRVRVPVQPAQLPQPWAAVLAAPVCDVRPPASDPRRAERTQGRPGRRRPVPRSVSSPAHAHRERSPESRPLPPARRCRGAQRPPLPPKATHRRRRPVLTTPTSCARVVSARPPAHGTAHRSRQIPDQASLD